MNNISKYIVGLSVVAGLMVSCKDDDQPNVSGFSLDKEEIVISDPNGGVELVNVLTESEWNASTDATWIQLAPGNGVGQAEVEVKADSSILSSIRQANIQFYAKGEGVKTVSVKQFGYKKEISLAKAELNIESNAPYEKRFFDVTVTSNVNFTVEIPQEAKSWLELKKGQDIVLDYGERPRTGKLRFNWKINTHEENREAEIRFVPKNVKEGEEAETVVLKITQEHAPILTDDRAGDSLAVLSIYQGMDGMFKWDASENMRNWKNVVLWKNNDKVDGKKIPSKMVGRVRAVSFTLFDTKESIPYQISQLRFAESITFFSNANREMKKIELGNDICTLLNGHPLNAEFGNGKPKSFLKALNISSFGLVKLPKDFKSDVLEFLDLSSVNFTDDAWLRQVNQANFPALKSLVLTNMRVKSVVSSLKEDGDLGFRWETSFGNKGIAYNGANNRNAFVELMKWENLEELYLSFSLLEGELPTDAELQQQPYNFSAYQDADFAAVSDTIKDGQRFLVGHQITRVWPKMKSLSLNLNFLTGKLPSWLLYHPNLGLWNPYSFIFPQDEVGVNSLGKKVGFVGGEPRSMRDYSNFTEELGYDAYVGKNGYYSVFPKRDPNYRKEN